MDDAFEACLVGHFMARKQLVAFFGRSLNIRRKRFCYPSAILDDITAVFDGGTSNGDKNTLIFVHAGTNDVQTTRSEVLLEKHLRMINLYES